MSSSNINSVLNRVKLFEKQKFESARKNAVEAAGKLHLSVETKRQSRDDHHESGTSGPADVEWPSDDFDDIRAPAPSNHELLPDSELGAKKNTPPLRALSDTQFPRRSKDPPSKKSTKGSVAAKEEVKQRRDENNNLILDKYNVVAWPSDDETVPMSSMPIGAAPRLGRQNRLQKILSDPLRHPSPRAVRSPAAQPTMSSPIMQAATPSPAVQPTTEAQRRLNEALKRSLDDASTVLGEERATSVVTSSSSLSMDELTNIAKRALKAAQAKQKEEDAKAENDDGSTVGSYTSMSTKSRAARFSAARRRTTGMRSRFENHADEVSVTSGRTCGSGKSAETKDEVSISFITTKSTREEVRNKALSLGLKQSQIRMQRKQPSEFEDEHGNLKEQNVDADNPDHQESAPQYPDHEHLIVTNSHVQSTMAPPAQLIDRKEPAQADALNASPHASSSGVRREAPMNRSGNDDSSVMSQSSVRSRSTRAALLRAAGKVKSSDCFPSPLTKADLSSSLIASPIASSMVAKRSNSPYSESIPCNISQRPSLEKKAYPSSQNGHRGFSIPAAQSHSPIYSESIVSNHSSRSGHRASPNGPRKFSSPSAQNQSPHRRKYEHSSSFLQSDDGSSMVSVLPKGGPYAAFQNGIRKEKETPIRGKGIEPQPLSPVRDHARRSVVSVSSRFDFQTKSREMMQYEGETELIPKQTSAHMAYHSHLDQKRNAPQKHRDPPGNSSTVPLASSFVRDSNTEEATQNGTISLQDNPKDSDINTNIDSLGADESTTEAITMKESSDSRQSAPNCQDNDASTLMGQLHVLSSESHDEAKGESFTKHSDHFLLSASQEDDDNHDPETVSLVKSQASSALQWWQKNYASNQDVKVNKLVQNALLASASVADDPEVSNSHARLTTIESESHHEAFQQDFPTSAHSSEFPSAKEGLNGTREHVSVAEPIPQVTKTESQVSEHFSVEGSIFSGLDDFTLRSQSSSVAKSSVCNKEGEEQDNENQGGYLPRKMKMEAGSHTPPPPPQEHFGEVLDESQLLDTVNSDITSSVLAPEEGTKETSNGRYPVANNKEKRDSALVQLTRASNLSSLPVSQEAIPSSANDDDPVSASRREADDVSLYSEQQAGGDKGFGTVFFKFGNSILESFNTICRVPDVNWNQGSCPKGTTGDAPELQSLHSGSGSASQSIMNDLEARKWDEWDRRDSQSLLTPSSVATSRFTATDASRTTDFTQESSADIFGRQAKAHEKLVQYTRHALSMSSHESSSSNSKPSVFASSESSASFTGQCGDDTGAWESSAFDTEGTRSRITVQSSTSIGRASRISVATDHSDQVSLSESPAHKSLPTALSLNQRRILEKFSASLKIQGVEVLKQNRDTKWQLRFLTASKELTEISHVKTEGEKAFCPMALLWLKKLNPRGKADYSTSMIDKQGRGGVMLSDLVKVTALGRSEPAGTFPKKYQEKFNDSVTVIIDYKLNDAVRSMVLRCKSTDEAHFLCTGLRVCMDVLKREDDVTL